MENENKKKNKKRLIAGFAVLAAVAVIGLTNVAGLWSSTATTSGSDQTFTTGGLSIAYDADSTLIELKSGSGVTTDSVTTASVSGYSDVEAEASAWRLVPQDQVVVSRTYKVKAQGHNLKVGVTLADGSALGSKPATSDLTAAGDSDENATYIQNLFAISGATTTPVNATNLTYSAGTITTTGDALGTVDIKVSYTLTFTDTATTTANEGNSFTGDGDAGTAATARKISGVLAGALSGIKLTQIIA